MTLDEILKGHTSVAITGHLHPDGDCVGAVLAVYRYLTNNYPDIYAEPFLGEPGEKLSFLWGYDKINTARKSERRFDLMLALDCASSDRLGKTLPVFENARHTVCIDHHISNTNFADENYVCGGLSSCCEMLYDMMDKSKIDREIALALYTGIIYDTGVFKYTATTPKTMRIAADLMEFGIPTCDIIDRSFYAKTYRENRIYGYAIEKSELLFGGAVIFSSIIRPELKKFGSTNKELEGIAAQLKLTVGVRCAAFMHEMKNGEYKVSLRSDETFDCNKVASVFGGGGHVQASGCTLYGSYDECRKNLLEEIEKAL